MQVRTTLRLTIATICIIEDACGDHTAAPLSLHFGVDRCGKQAGKLSKQSKNITSNQIKQVRASVASKPARRQQARRQEGREDNESTQRVLVTSSIFRGLEHRNFAELLGTTPDNRNEYLLLLAGGLWSRNSSIAAARAQFWGGQL